MCIVLRVGSSFFFPGGKRPSRKEAAGGSDADAGLPVCIHFSRYPVVVSEREFFIDNLLVRIHCIIVMIRWTGLAPWEFEVPFPGSLTSTFLGRFT